MKSIARPRDCADLAGRMREELEHRRDQGTLRTVSSRAGSVDLTSNDYLGFARRPLAASSRHPMGSGGSRLLSGHQRIHEECERFIADFHGVEAALLLPTGYSANLAVLATVPRRGDTVLYDADAHASIRDGIRLGRARGHAFDHNSLSSLRTRIARAGGQAFVVCEAVYSMDGSRAPLAAIADLCDEHGAALIVDEAHSVGWSGPRGAGRMRELGLERAAAATIVTFGKALGCQGAAILGSRDLKEYLINYARPFIYSTAPAPALVAHILGNYRALRGSASGRRRLAELIVFFKSCADDSGLPFLPSDSPIQALLVPGNEEVREVATRLQMQGFDARPIVSPTVRAGTERIRFCLHSYNSVPEIKRLFEVLTQGRGDPSCASS